MSLIDSFMDECVLMEKTRISDGEGGMTTTYTEGLTIKAAITMDTSMQARIAEKDGVTSTYTVTTAKTVSLDYHDVIKRKADGKIFRITSDKNEKMSPSVSTLNINQVTAEKWSLTE